MKRYWIEEIPPLRDPALIAAFAGWNDAAEAATTAVQVLIQEWSAKRFAGIDPEEFYVFTDVRPGVRIAGGSQRRIDWPANDFYYCQAPSGERDYVLLLGVEPNLQWRTFTKTVLEIMDRSGVKLMVSLGALLADVPHTSPPRLVGSGTSAELLAGLRRLNVPPSRYEGPTGILGVLNAACREAGIAAASIWGNVPHYISETANPRVASALLHRLVPLLDLQLNFHGLDELCARFDEELREAIAGNQEIADYIRQLEERAHGAADAEANESEVEGETRPETEGAEAPSSEALIKELEEFLKRRRREDQDATP